MCEDYKLEFHVELCGCTDCFHHASFARLQDAFEWATAKSKNEGFIIICSTPIKLTFQLGYGKDRHEERICKIISNNGDQTNKQWFAIQDENTTTYGTELYFKDGRLVLFAPENY